MTTLNDIMEFDHVVFVDEAGHVHDWDVLTGEHVGLDRSASRLGSVHPRTRLYAPELFEGDDGDPVLGEDAPERDVKADSRALQAQAHSAGWDRLLEGFTGQYSYNGPVMHPSEYIGGGLERHILANPGWYCAVVVSDTDDDGTYSGEVAGWAVAYKAADEYDGPWVSVVFAQDREEWGLVGKGPEEMAEHLSQWDYGQETDDAHTDVAKWGSDDRLYRVGEYVLAINYQLGYASLNRRPKGQEVTR